MNIDRESALEGIIRLTPKLLVGTTTTQLDEDYLPKSFKFILEQCGNFLGFERAEAFLVRDVNRRIRPALNYKKEELYEDYIISIGYTKEELEADLNILNSWRENKITLNLEVKHPSSYVLRTGHYMQCYADEDFIRQLEEQGIVKENYYEFRIERYKSYLDTIKGKEEPLSFEDWSRFSFFPLLRELNGSTETIGYVNFEKPTESLGKKPIPEEKMEIAQLTINSAMLPITVSIFADVLRQAQAELINTANLSIIGQFAGGIAHDINNFTHNQIQRVLLLQKSLRGQEIPKEELLAELDEIISTSLSIQEWSERINRYAKQGKGKMQYGILNSCIDDTVAMFEKQLQEKEIELSVGLDKELPDIMLVPGQLNQVYTNFFFNSIEAIEQKRTRISDERYKPKIRISTYTLERAVFSTFYDNGIGIKEENLERIFEPSFSTRETVGRGSSGLGLSICRKVISDHGGKISVKSVYGQETEFTISLPITKD